ncbi:hypothetical protein G3580_18400 [Nitrogeniibacter mangrovi]|uniref:Uncharacterized protein n=1 Tax=Nitrogeniibacter mangrovi TaxID=2016596 RepID=A0A6C1B6P6_9RHOO|nr:hypothetical protein [Nitrogeniibacter mangrovi]QID19412.1 hypothetical protein G3580_18400 [Nitrogeniibacter mangrovi]
MSQQVIVSFGADKDYEFIVHPADKADMDKDAARAWLAREFEDLECTPSNPMGKILVLDMILNVAKYGGEARFQTGGDWAGRFAAAVAASLDRPVVKVDVAAFVVG